MKEGIRRRALELGFDDCRFTTAAPPESAERFRQWLASGQHGEMGYLARNADKRVNPRQVLSGARSIITLAANYASEDRGTKPGRDASPRRPPPAQNGRLGEAHLLSVAQVSKPAVSPTASRQVPGSGEICGLETRDTAGLETCATTPRNTLAECDEAALPEACAASGAPQRTGVIARYARYADYHEILGEGLQQLASFANQLGGPHARSLWYVDTGPLLERDLAQRAGLGFIGKHTNVISRRLGNWFFLSEIITTLELEPDAPEKNRCGSCTRCIAACPTAAITGPFQLDARRCISYLTIELKGPIPPELRPAIGNRIYGCDDCLAVCPWNRFAQEGQLMKAHARPDLATPNLLELLTLDEAGFKRQFAGTPMLRTKRRGLLRNACVALGNIGDESALPALQEAAADPEPLIAEHARWAIEQVETRVKAKT